MKKFFTFFAAVACVATISADVTLDVTTVTDMELNAVTYCTTPKAGYLSDMVDVMDSTYSEDGNYFWLLANEGEFMLSHLQTGYSYSGSSWEGFTTAKIASDTLNQFGCAAKGGVNGIGTPYMVGYYSEYALYTIEEESPCVIYFSDEKEVKSTYVCMNTYALNTVRNGDSYAKKFTESDSLTLVIAAMDEDGYSSEEVAPVLVNLAKGSDALTAWTKVDLSSLGSTYGLIFSLRTTDLGQWGSNTPLYFCMDQLTIADVPTDVEKVNATVVPTHKQLRNGQLIIMREGKSYNVMGATL